jgi:transposase-like protein
VSPARDRRQFTTAFKVQILEEAARCVAPGALGALLRREGLYSSHLSVWRAAAMRGELTGPARRHGPKPVPPDPNAKRVITLERALAKALARAEHAEALVDLQEKWRKWGAKCVAEIGHRAAGLGPGSGAPRAQPQLISLRLGAIVIRCWRVERRSRDPHRTLRRCQSSISDPVRIHVHEAAEMTYARTTDLARLPSDTV